MKNTHSPHEDHFDLPQTGEYETTQFDPQPHAPETHATDAPDTSLVPVDATPPTTKQPVERKVTGSFAGGTWIALIAGALLLILLLIFILQNQQETQLNLFAWSFAFPAGVGYLLAAITGALIMALVGGVRMLQLRRQVRNP